MRQGCGIWSRLSIGAGLGLALLPLPQGGALAQKMFQASPASPHAVDWAKARPALDSYFRKQAARDLFSGAVLVAYRGRTMFSGGYGLADRERHRPVTTDTKFNLGSVNKFMTRIAIYQLAEAGKLSLSDTVGKILPDYPNAAVREKVTVDQLAEMKGGIPDYWNDRYEARRKNLRTTDDFLALFADQPLRFEPGEKYEYSSGGYIVLGKIIERVSGMSYEDYVRRHITGPAGMASTSLDAPRSGARGYAVGYTRLSGMAMEGGPEGPLRSNAEMLPGWGSSAGGGYSTARDLARLDLALRSGKLLRRAAMARFFGREFMKGRGEPSGWIGGSPGAMAVFSVRPDDITIIVLVNRDPPLGYEMRGKVLQILGLPPPSSPHSN